MRRALLLASVLLALLGRSARAAARLPSLPCADGLERHRQRERLEQDAAGVVGVELDRVELGHAHPLVRLELDVALLLEHPQHLAQRRPAHAELLGERHLRQLRARRDTPVEDAFAQVGVQVGNRLPGLGEVQAHDPGDAGCRTCHMQHCSMEAQLHTHLGRSLDAVDQKCIQF